MAVIWEPELNAEAQKWRAVADDLSREHCAPLAEELDREQRYPWETIPRLVDSGLAGLFLPREHGGQGASLTATVSVVERIAEDCASTAAILCAYQLGAFPLLLAGTPEQKDLYLRAMAEGTATSFALSERTAGSDPAAMATTGVEEGEGWRLRGEKFWIGNGGASRYYVAFVKTDPEAGGRGITAFMVDKEAEGVSVDHLSDKMGIRGTQTSNLRLDTLVPQNAQVGERGRALRLALKTLNVGRIMVSAQSLGLAIGAFREAAARAVSRQTFGKAIIDNQGIAFPLADVATQITAARLLLYRAAEAYDRGEDVQVIGAQAKLFCSEVAHKAADVAMQVWAGDGYCKPSKVERLYRDQRILEIYEGTSEIQRLVLGRAIRSEVEAKG
ncbi:acyl-CoA dehydrogenase family protein [Aquibaculum sediminis]|uniref:acyl-CoA dehydrogenase family protein n=1 Tax=Aquibaculum sediminis TaxID=3231907 RepID=UPI0034547EE8